MNKIPIIIVTIVVIILLCCCSMCALLWTLASLPQQDEPSRYSVQPQYERVNDSRWADGI
ncbi:MAG: hypothetical protein LBU31_02410 [Coriobacteriales bacterium]|jgi:flagellar basal body-associated protein FliL|nr:hypothetical protein [Coriobacteriales bacterium]